MAKQQFNPKDLEQMKSFLDLQEKIAENMRKGTVSFVKSAYEARKIRKDIEKGEQRINDIKKEQKALEESLVKLSGEDLKLAKARLKILEEEKKEQQDILDENLALEASLKRQTKSIKNISIAIGRDVAKGLKKVYGISKKLSTEYFEQEDSIRRTAVNIGLLGKQQEQFRKTVYKSALATQRLGMNASALAETYGSYVDNVGRLIPLTEKAAYAMSEMAMGTALGKEGAAEMAGNMEVFGMSIQSTAKYVEDVSNMSEKMGINSGKVLNLLNKNMKQAQTVRFKDGVKGIAKMAALSTKLRMDMSQILGLAQDLWEPEKAIETAAQLQMMGGAFARMGDPLKLMFDARNNPAKLMEDLANAAASVAKNMGDGTYDIPAMELQKLKQIAEATGQDFQTLVETAKTTARQKDIEKMMNPRIGKEGKEFISSIAQWSEKDGGFVVTVDGETKKVSELSQNQVKSMLAQNESLDKRAKEAQGFMTLLQNFFNSFKNLANSFFAGMEKNLRGPIEKLMGTGKGSLADFSETVYSAGESFGSWIASFVDKIPAFIEGVKGIGKKIGEFFSPENFGSLKTVAESVVSGAQKLWSGITSVASKIASVGEAIFSVLGPKGLFFAGLALIFRRQIMGMIGGLFQRGSSPMRPMFVSDISGGMGGGMMGGRNMMGMRGMKGISSIFGGKKTMVGRGLRNIAASFGKRGGAFGARGGMSFMSSLGKGMKGFGVGTIASMGLDIGRSFLDDPNSGLGKAMGVGATVAGDAATGALIGSIIPGVGNVIGGIVGGIVGLGRGLYSEFSEKVLGEYDVADKVKGIQKNKLAIGGTTTGAMLDGAVMPDGNVIKTAKGAMYSLAPKDVVSIGQPGSGSGGSGSVDINGTIQLAANGKTIDLNALLDDPIFVREITKVITSTMKTQNR